MTHWEKHNPTSMMRMYVCYLLSSVLLCDPTDPLSCPPSMRFTRQEYWCGLPCPSPGDLPNPGIKPRSPAWQADALPSEPPGGRGVV